MGDDPHYIERHGAPASRRPSRSMATRSVVGSTCNATGIPKAPLDADRERRLRDLTGLDLGPQGRPLAPERAPYDRTTDNRGPFAELRDWKGNLDHDLVLLARRAEQAHTALTLNFVDGDHALLEQFLGFARHDPDRIVKLRTV